MVALGADHAGYGVKEKIKELLISMRKEIRDFGTYSSESVDYPDFAGEVAKMVSAGNAEYGILVCGTGIGMSIVANKYKGIRASNVESAAGARFARSHNNANVLAIGARLTPWVEVEKIVKVFLSTPFEGGRHQRRVDKIHSLTNL